MARLPPAPLLLAVALAQAATVAGARCRPDAAAVAAYEGPGPLPVAQTTLTFVDESRVTPPNGTWPGAPSRTLVTEVWFPSSPSGALLDAGPYPLVVHSHGFLDTRIGEDYLARHLASHGYVVAAADFPLSNGSAPGGATFEDVEHQPGDVRVVVDRILALSATPGSVLGGMIDAERIGASGLSLGGLTTLLATYHRDLRDPRIRAALPIAAPACFFTPRFFRTARTPLLLLHGTSDLLVPFAENAARTARAAGPRARLVALDEASHTGFSSFAPLFDQSAHLDRIGCAAIAPSVDGAVDATDSPFLDLATPGSGVSSDVRRCPRPCTDEALAEAPEPAMPAARQHAIARAVVAAFFDATLRNDGAARCVLRKGLRAAYGDLSVRAR